MIGQMLNVTSEAEAHRYVFPVLPVILACGTSFILERWKDPQTAVDLMTDNGCTFATAILNLSIRARLMKIGLFSAQTRYSERGDLTGMKRPATWAVDSSEYGGKPS